MIIGVDPGIDGAIALLYPATSKAAEVSVHDMPTCAKDRGKGRQVNVHELAAIIPPKSKSGRPVAVCELVTSTPQMGVTSAFSFGRSAGVVEGVLVAMEWPLIYVRPQRWKKHFGLIGKDKDVARTLAIQLYPWMAGRLHRKKDVGRAEALLIAQWHAEVRA